MQGRDLPEEVLLELLELGDVGLVLACAREHVVVLLNLLEVGLEVGPESFAYYRKEARRVREAASRLLCLP